MKKKKQLKSETGPRLQEGYRTVAYTGNTPYK
jgi:hypothetical protein